MTNTKILVVALLVVLVASLVIGGLVWELAKPRSAPVVEAKQETMPQGWNIVYHMTNNNIPESIVYISSNKMFYRFAVDLRTNLIGSPLQVR